MSERLDLSNWVLHFVHDQSSNTEPDPRLLDFLGQTHLPFHPDPKVNPAFDLWRISDEENSHRFGHDAFSVLRKIFEDGHLRSGWSFRKSPDGQRATIYGPRPAVCFTEMPLYALLKYAKMRSSDHVASYAIGLLRDEAYRAGARPAIYGLTGKHREVRPDLPVHLRWPRLLDPSCGIAEIEQYRYVATSLDPSKPIDWTHEREWRWSDATDQLPCPGLPIWYQNEGISFSQAMILVASRSEANAVLDLLKTMFDSGSHDYGQEYDRALVESTLVISLEELAEFNSPSAMKTIRLEDIPAQKIRKFRRPKATPEMKARVQAAYREADQAAKLAALCKDSEEIFGRLHRGPLRLRPSDDRQPAIRIGFCSPLAKARSRAGGNWLQNWRLSGARKR